MNRRTRLGCWPLLLSLLSPAAAAEVYRWTDEQGQVHYEDRSRSQRDAGTRSYAPPKAAPGNPQQRMEKTRRLLNAYRVERQQSREQKRKEKEAREKRRRKCIVAKDRLRQYRNYGAIYRLDKDGKRVYLDEQQRGELMQKSRAEVSRWCG